MCSPPSSPSQRDLSDRELLLKVLPDMPLYRAVHIAEAMGIDEDSVTRHAASRPTRYEKTCGRWEWPDKTSAVEFCLFLLVVSYKARQHWDEVKAGMRAADTPADITADTTAD